MASNQNWDLTQTLPHPTIKTRLVLILFKTSPLALQVASTLYTIFFGDVTEQTLQLFFIF